MVLCKRFRVMTETYPLSAGNVSKCLSETFQKRLPAETCFLYLPSGKIINPGDGNGGFDALQRRASLFSAQFFHVRALRIISAARKAVAVRAFSSYEKASA